MKTLQSICIKLLFLLSSSVVSAQESPKFFQFQFENTEIEEVVKIFARESNQKFIVDSGIRAKINIFVAKPVPQEEAFHLLSKALATKGIGMAKHGEVWIVKKAKQLQRDLIPVVTNLPDPIPERMLSYVVTLKYLTTDFFMKKLKIYLSKDGEINAVGENKLVVIDWVSNLYQMQSLLNELDKEDTKFPVKTKQ